MTLPTFHTARLTMRPLAVSDSLALHELFGDPEAMRYWDAPPAADAAETAKRVEWLTRSDPRGHAAWVMIANADGTLAGFVDYQRAVRGLEVRYVLARRCWGQGLMSEAMVPFLEHCFGALNASRVEAMIEPGNVAAVRLAERFGFRFERGPLEDRMQDAGTFRSVNVYVLLAPEWAAAR
jgi:ribosomal-protein-alanine N-acetyltransferase